jgi:hypothetical protein
MKASPISDLEEDNIDMDLAAIKNIRIPSNVNHITPSTSSPRPLVVPNVHPRGIPAAVPAFVPVTTPYHARKADVEVERSVNADRARPPPPQALSSEMVSDGDNRPPRAHLPEVDDESYHESYTRIGVPSERDQRSIYSGFESGVERARQVPLPISVVSGPGYTVSVAPSDRIGIKRERERLRDRMVIRDSSSRGW